MAGYVTTRTARQALAASVATTGAPTLRVLSLGAGVQSTALALMASEGSIPPIDAAIFADTGWEPRHVYDQLRSVGSELERAGIPLLLVSGGNLRRDIADPDRRYASIPYHTQTRPGPCPRCAGTGRAPGRETVVSGLPAGGDTDQGCRRCRGTGWHDGRGLGRRQCTAEYKLAPIRRELRRVLGATSPHYRRVPRGRVAEVLIGFSTDEIARVNSRPEVRYERKTHPLIDDLSMSRADCERWLRSRGWTGVGKSACIGCPFHSNAYWRALRAQSPEEWADAVAVDRAIRKGGTAGAPLDGEAFLHRSRVPLELAPIGHVTRAEWRERQGDLFELAADDAAGPGRALPRPPAALAHGCSPYGCAADGASGDDVDSTAPGPDDAW